MKNDQDMDDSVNMSRTSTKTNAGQHTQRPPSPVPSCVSMKSDQSREDPPYFSSELGPSGLKMANLSLLLSQVNQNPLPWPRPPPPPLMYTQQSTSGRKSHRIKLPRSSDRGDADSAVWSEDSMPRHIDFSGTQPNNDRGDADSAVWSEDSMPRHIDFSGTQPHNLIHQSGVCHCCEGSCGVCLGNVHHAVKHCKTCSVSYCETHVADHYRSPAFSSHELVDYKQTSRAKQRSLQRSSSDPVVLPELRVMMLGQTGTGKSASGNTILGREAFKSEASALPVTKRCDSQSGVVEGRNITVIDTPAITTRKAAWLSEKVDPGPHVFLLVIRLGRFTEEDRPEVKWIQSNFGEEALKFTIVLFTVEDQLKGKTLEDFLHESPKLQTLLGRVEGRCHVFDNSLPEERYQVKGLIKKIENVLISKLGYAYTHEEQERVKTVVRQEGEREKTERTRDQELENVKTAARQEYEREKEKAERTRNQEQEKVNTAVRKEGEREKAERTMDQEEMNMRDNQANKAGTLWRLQIFLSVLMFLTFHCCYKDSVELLELRVMMLGKTGTGKSASGNTILGREAFKSKASALPVTKSCDIQSGVVEGRNITVTEEVKWIQRNFGEEALKFTIVLFTGRDQINAEEFLNESSRLQTLVSSTGGGYHIFDNKTPRRHGQVKGLLEKIELLLRKNKGYSYSDGLHEQVTTAVREEKERNGREEERERREEERKRREEERKRRGEERKRREEERERRKEKRREERTTEQSWNLGNILNGFIGFVLRVIMKKIWYL